MFTQLYWRKLFRNYLRFTIEFTYPTYDIDVRWIVRSLSDRDNFNNKKEEKIK